VQLAFVEVGRPCEGQHQQRNVAVDFVRYLRKSRLSLSAQWQVFELQDHRTAVLRADPPEQLGRGVKRPGS